MELDTTMEQSTPELQLQPQPLAPAPQPTTNRLSDHITASRKHFICLFANYVLTFMTN